MIKNSDGLRERKRLETRKNLEQATITLVARDGLEHVTIEMISNAANVSPRTFFNYFDSKEDAVLGLYSVGLSEDELDAFAQHYQNDPILVATTGLMMQLIGPSMSDPDIFKMRRKLIKQHPQLLERQMSRIARTNKLLIATVQRMIQARTDTPLLEGEAEILLSLCSSSIRIVIRDWVSSNKTLSLTKLEHQAIQNLQEVLKKIHA